MTISHKISLDSLSAAQLPVEQAKGLPNAAYNDAEVFAFERDNVIGKTWAALEFVSALPHSGYMKPIDFMGLPILVLRDRNDEIKVFHNVCSHRGMILVPEEGPAKNLIRCRYHSWSYDLNGELKSTPHIGGVGVNTAPGFSCEGNGLKQIRSAIWMGMIFVNLSGDEQPFAEFIKPLVQRWEAFTGAGAFESLEVAETFSRNDFNINANWKLAIENYCEAYHLPWVHPELNSYSPLSAHYNLHVNDYMSGQGTLNYTLSKVSGSSLPAFPDWPNDRLSEGEYISLFPNVLLGVQVDHTFAIILQPIACDKTLEKLQLFYVNKDAVDAPMANCREAVMDAWQLVFSEDIFAVEGMQQGRSSPGFTGGVFSPVLDTPTHDFHKWVAKRYQAAMTSE